MATIWRSPSSRSKGHDWPATHHAYEQSARQLDVWAYNDRGAGAQIAEDFGFTPARRLLHLHRDVVDVPDLAAPPGVVLRPMWAGEEGALLALNNRIFAAHPENGSWTMEDLRARMVQPWFDRGDVLILERNGAPAGFCWLKIEARPGEGRVAEIYVIGTAPEARGLGLGRLLVARGLAHAVARDADVAAIYVEDSNAAAVALYTSSGFHHHHVDVCYSRRFEANEAAPTVEPAQEASAA
ncbi:MAG: mycothiol synthase [Chloroflexi bacterium]|nr:mycothiol synthase [Chloroflexota bacterium]